MNEASEVARRDRSAAIFVETERLVLRRFSVDDDEFILRLVNEPSWLRFIGDRGVRTLEDARGYILKGPVASYERFGFGLYLVSLKAEGTPIGMCGLIKRDTLDDVDIGFAFLPEFWGRGYARESAAAVMALAKDTIGLHRLVAITTPENRSSIQLLEKIGMAFERMIVLPDDPVELMLFGCRM